MGLISSGDVCVCVCMCMSVQVGGIHRVTVFAFIYALLDMLYCGTFFKNGNVSADF